LKYLAETVTLELEPDLCTGCGLCLQVCPHDVFRLEGRKAVINDRDSCMECGACVLNCAFGALQVEKGVGCAAAIINGMLTGSEPSCGCNDDGSGATSCC
jgi:NAD-dependent dihydropyrimidine dehydrogenase PreA subunit